MDGSGTWRELTAPWCGVANSLRLESASEAAWRARAATWKRRARSSPRSLPLTFSHHIQSARRGGRIQQGGPQAAKGSGDSNARVAVTLGNFHRIRRLYPLILTRWNEDLIQIPEG
jgi:hypothetical protein